MSGRPWTLRVSIGGDAAAIAQADAAEGRQLNVQDAGRQQQGIDSGAVDNLSQPVSPPATYQEALAACVDKPDLACLTAAAKLPLEAGQFRFPHAFIVGYQKCATTSLFATLIHHPQVLSAKIKVRRRAGAVECMH